MWLNFSPAAVAGGASAMLDIPQPLREPRPLRPAVFIDKDGALLERSATEHADPARLHLLPGAGEAMAALAEAGFALVIVATESGLARGTFSRAEFAALQSALYLRLREEFGVLPTDLVLCPHAPGRNGAPACLCRKPAPGLLVRAARAHRLDLARSTIIGDTLDDIEAGHRAGCRALLLDNGGETAWRRSPLRQPDGVVSEWTAAARWLIEASAVPASPSADARPS